MAVLAAHLKLFAVDERVVKKYELPTSIRGLLWS
jgi:hypothetical protein